MFYVVSVYDNKILEALDQCPDPAQMAQEMGCGVYIIEGQHTGLTGYPDGTVDPY